MKKSIGVLILTAILGMTSMLSGCGGGAQNAGDKPESTDKNTQKAEPQEISIFMDAEAAKAIEDGKHIGVAVAEFEKQTGIKIKPQVVPGKAAEIFQKIDISLTTGDKTDVIMFSNDVLSQKYSENGWLLPLNSFIKKDDYQAEKIHGEYLSKIGDQIYTLPNAVSQWAVYYNKQIFDDAGVPYPKGPWTWEQYIETAKKLNDPKKGIYGSFMLNFDNFFYFWAKQYGLSGYNKQGLSDYDNPKFAEALKFFGSLGNEHKIQPSWLEQATKKIPGNAFVTGKYGMVFVGTWYFTPLGDKEKFPRDWKFGMVQTPVPNLNDANRNFGTTESIGINKNAKNPEAAYKFIQFMAENSYKYIAKLPARVDLPDDELNKALQILSDKVNGEVTTQELKKALFDNGMDFISEKVNGSAADEYSGIIKQEGELYLIGQKSLEETVSSIKKRVDEAIANEKK